MIFPVRATIDLKGALKFKSKSQILVKYLRLPFPNRLRNVRAAKEPKKEQAERAAAPQLTDLTVWREDGTTQLHSKYWSITDQAPLVPAKRTGKPGEHEHATFDQPEARVATVTFLADKFSNDFSDAEKRTACPEAQGLFEAFLAQEAIQLSVNVDGILATLSLRLVATTGE